MCWRGKQLKAVLQVAAQCLEVKLQLLQLLKGLAAGG
jgi:hypothetical protein